MHRPPITRTWALLVVWLLSACSAKTHGYWTTTVAILLVLALGWGMTLFNDRRY